MEGLKSFTFLVGREGGGGGIERGFLYLGDGGSPSTTGQKFTHPSLTWKSPPVDSPQNFYYPPTKAHSPTK